MTGNIQSDDFDAGSSTPPANPCTEDGDESGPAMVAIRPGRFLMGSPANEVERSIDEGPQHTVTIPKPFAIGRCEVTVGQFRRFVDDTHYQTTAETGGKGCFVWDREKKSWQQSKDVNWRNPGFSQNDGHPVVCVSWADAQRYAAWLAQRSGAPYRLPTEAEWEYAARADTETARYFGDQSQCDYANGLGQEVRDVADKNWTLADCADGFVYTAPVASFQSNAFGLYDLLGNVLEWTIDCWHGDYAQKPPVDGTAWLEADNGECVRRVVRGGSWDYDPRILRSAGRGRGGTGVAGGLPWFSSRQGLVALCFAVCLFAFLLFECRAKPLPIFFVRLLPTARGNRKRRP